MKCCLWLGFKVELIMVQRRAGQGQRQATHNKHIPGSFTCYASQETCFTQAAGLCGRMGRIFLLMCIQKESCTKRDTNPSHPLTRPDTFAFVISSRSQTPDFFPFPLSSNSHSSLSLSFLPATTPLLSLSSPSWRLMSWEPWRMKGEKPAC